MKTIDDRTILNAFRRGFDTVEIVKALNMTEAKVSRHLWVARCREKNRPAIYLNKRGSLKRISDLPILKSA